MSKAVRTFLIAALALVAFGAASSTTLASVTLTTGGNYTATTTGRQSLRTTINGIIPSTITCSQTANFNLVAGTYSGAGNTVGAINGAGVAFTCDPISLGTPQITTLPAPANWALVGDEARFGATSGLVNITGVRINVTIPGVISCLFGSTTATLGIGINNNTATGSLLGGGLASNSASCSNGVVSPSGYNFSRAVSWRIP